MYRAGSFIQGSSLFHKLDPRVKLSAVVVFSIFILWVKAPLALAGGGILLLLALTGGIRLRIIGEAIKPFLFFIALILFVHVFFGGNNRYETIPNPFLRFSFSATGAQEGFFVIWRFLCLITSAVLLTMTTVPAQIVAAVKYFLQPLKKLKVPVDDLAVMIMLALRLMPILLGEKERIEVAQKARGYQIRQAGGWMRLKSFILLATRVLTGVFRCADELALAMEARNYQRKERSSLVQLNFRAADLFAVIILSIFFVIFVALNFHFG